MIVRLPLRSYTHWVSVRSRRAAPADSPAAGTAAREGDGAADTAAPSGRLLLRMPRTLHGALTESAEREGTSLNQFITGTLASAIGWNGESQGADGSRPAPRDTESRVAEPSRALLAILIANAVAVGLAALGAVGILLLAWLG